MAYLQRKLREWYCEAPNGANPAARTGDEEDEGGLQNPSIVAATAFPAVGTGDSSDRLEMDKKTFSEQIPQLKQRAALTRVQPGAARIGINAVAVTFKFRVTGTT